MADKTVITVSEDDTTPLHDTISYPAGSTVVLAGATVAFYMETPAGVPKINGTACTVTIDDVAKTIDWKVAIGATDFDTPGLYYPYLIITYADGVLETVRLFENYVIKVVPRGLV